VFVQARFGAKTLVAFDQNASDRYKKIITMRQTELNYEKLGQTQVPAHAVGSIFNCAKNIYHDKLCVLGTKGEEPLVAFLVTRRTWLEISKCTG